MEVLRLLKDPFWRNFSKRKGWLGNLAEAPFNI